MSKRRVIQLHQRGRDSSTPEPPKQTSHSERNDLFARGLEALGRLSEARIAAYLEARQGNKPAPPSRPLAALCGGDVPVLAPDIADERVQLLLWLALVPHLQPDFFESIVLRSMPGGGDLPIFGGVKGGGHRGLLPTGETAQFLLAGQDLPARLELCTLFDEERALHQEGILWLEPVREGEPAMGGRIVMAREWVEQLLFGTPRAPRFGVDFAAKRIDTRMTWDDAVLHPHTRKQVDELALWLAHRQRLMQDENLGRKLKPGYRVLFYGPPGTGKTLTAALLGKRFARDVYRVDLSQVVSKYIGETEKNLEGVFKRAQTRDWILFFDEADALFGKRTNVQSAHDKYANQEVSYLLQRVEDFPGLLILASNYKNNLDDAFLRRFHALVHFPMPSVSDRLALWQKSLPTGITLADDADLPKLAKSYEMTGAAIINAVQFAVLQVYARDDSTLRGEDLVEGVRREFMKEEKSI